MHTWRLSFSCCSMTPFAIAPISDRAGFGVSAGNVAAVAEPAPPLEPSAAPPSAPRESASFSIDGAPAGGCISASSMPQMPSIWDDTAFCPASGVTSSVPWHATDCRLSEVRVHYMIV